MTDNNQLYADNGATNELVESPIEDDTHGDWGREVATSAWTTNPYEIPSGTDQPRNRGASYSGYRRTVHPPRIPGSATANQRSYSTSAWSPSASAADVRAPLPRLSYDGPNLGPRRRGTMRLAPRTTDTSAMNADRDARQVSPAREPDRHVTHDSAPYAQDPNAGRAWLLASKFSWMTGAQLGCLGDYIHTVPLLEPPLDLDETFSTKHPQDFAQPERWIYSAGDLICASQPADTVPLEAASVEEWRSIRAGLAHTAVALLSVVKGARDARIQVASLEELDLSAAFQAFHSALSSAMNDVLSAPKKRKKVESRARWDSTKPPQDAFVWTVKGPNNTVRSEGNPGGLFANAT